MMISGSDLCQASTRADRCASIIDKSYKKVSVERGVSDIQAGDYLVFKSPSQTASYVIGAIEGFYGEEGDTFADIPDQIKLSATHYSVNNDGKLCLHQADEQTRVCYVQA